MKSNTLILNLELLLQFEPSFKNRLPWETVKPWPLAFSAVLTFLIICFIRKQRRDKHPMMSLA